jgi:FkbM family methyltransferase
MNGVKKILLSVLGEKKYLSLLANSFQKIYKTELPGKDYQDVYFLKNIIEAGNYCVDIGAHLGYYTCELSRLVGNNGKVYAIEPMSKFNKILENLLRKKNINNVVLKQVALGGDGDFVEMGIPQVNNMKKFAYARVMQSSTHLEYIESEKVKNETGDNLFLNLPCLDFIKCDVEGLEVPVFSSMMQVLEKYHPILLCELADNKERIALYEMIKHFGYETYILKNRKLRLLDVHSDERAISHNHYFIPKERAEKIKQLINN